MSSTDGLTHYQAGWIDAGRWTPDDLGGISALERFEEITQIHQDEMEHCDHLSPDQAEAHRQYLAGQYVRDGDGLAHLIEEGY